MCLVKAAMGWKKICLVCVSVSILKGQHVSFCVTRCVGQRERLLLSRGKWRITWCTAYLAPDPCFMSLFSHLLCVCLYVWVPVVGVQSWEYDWSSSTVQNIFGNPKGKENTLGLFKLLGAGQLCLQLLVYLKRKEKKKKMLFYYKVFFSSLLNGNISHTCRETMWSKD